VWWCKAHKPKKVVIVVDVVKGVAPPSMMFSTTNDREVGCYDGYNVRCTQKINVEQVRSLELFMANKVKCHTLEHHQLIMEKFSCQSSNHDIKRHTCPFRPLLLLKNILKIFLIHLSKKH